MYATGVTKSPDQVTRQKSRMRKSCTSGSVRGASSDRRLYSTPRPAAVSRPPLSRSLWLAPPVLTGLPWFGWFPIDLARRNPRECWIPVPIAAPVGSAPNFLRRFRDREKPNCRRHSRDRLGVWRAGRSGQLLSERRFISGAWESAILLYKLFRQRFQWFSFVWCNRGKGPGGPIQACLRRLMRSGR